MVRPERDAVLATYELAGAFPLDVSARVVAMEETTGTWTKIPERPGSRERELAGWVQSVDAATGRACVAYPVEIFESTNLAGVLSIVAGNLFGLGSLTRARLVDLDVPASFARQHAGPAFGIEGIRAAAGTSASRRPHGGTIVKPKVGLDPKATAAVAKEAALGGLDLIKDDETLTDQAFCPLDERARCVLEALDQARSETGKRTLYAVNLTASAADVARRWDTVKQYGATCAMIDVLTAGFDAVRELRRVVNVPIHGHRAMHGAMTRAKDFGIDMLVFARLARLCGVDQLHIGSAGGKMGHASRLPPLLRALQEPWHGLKPMMAVSSGGLHPGLVPNEVRAFGNDSCLQAGGGVHGHPDGTRAGARALMDAIEATHAGKALDDHPSLPLRRALAHWKGETYDYQP